MTPNHLVLNKARRGIAFIFKSNVFPKIEIREKTYRTSSILAARSICIRSLIAFPIAQDRSIPVFSAHAKEPRSPIFLSCASNENDEEMLIIHEVQLPAYVNVSGPNP
jgi:hypothetical protein